jgi:hypothetical protein
MTTNAHTRISDNTLAVGQHLRKARQHAQLTMRATAQKVRQCGEHWYHSKIAKIEYGERRLDMWEFVMLCRIYKIDPASTLALLAPDMLANKTA